MKDGLPGAGGGWNGAPELLPAVPENSVNGGGGAVNGAVRVTDANSFELLLVEEAAQFIFALQYRLVGTWPVGGPGEEVSSLG
eukprot:12093962-Heterocapsa_arctica.AAC.1